MIKQSLLMLSLLCVGSTYGMGWGWGGSIGSSDQDKMDQYDADSYQKQSNEWPNDSREELGMDHIDTGYSYADSFGSSNDTSSNSDDNTSSQEPINDSSNQDN